MSPTLLSLQILEVMMRRGGDWGVSELGTELGLARGRVHRHLALLTDAGYLAKDPHTRRYDLGWRLVLLGRRITERSPLVTIARPVTARLCEQVGQTIVFSLVTDQGVVVTETTSGSSQLSVSFPPGTTYGYNASAQGKIALAFADTEQKERWSQLPFQRRTDRTVMDPEMLWQQVGRARDAGWATAPEETFEGMNAVAVPVLGHDGQVLATLGMVAPGSVIPDEPSSEQTRPLLAAAKEISLAMGCSFEQLPPPLREA